MRNDEYDWELLNRDDAIRDYTHYVFVCRKTKAIALADHSLRDLSKPWTTYDGFVQVIGTPVPARLNTSSVYRFVPVLVNGVASRGLLPDQSIPPVHASVPTTDSVAHLVALHWPAYAATIEGKKHELLQACRKWQPGSVLVTRRELEEWLAASNKPAGELRRIRRSIDQTDLHYRNGVFYTFGNDPMRIVLYRYGTECYQMLPICS
jgi:hypothetical protein